MTRILALLIAAALLASCTSDSVGEQAQQPPEQAQSASVDGSQSVLDVLPEDEIERFTADERYLASLLISPTSLDNPYRVNVVQADDPNGSATIGDRWYEPRLRVDGCSYATDQAPMPIVEAGYLPGDPNESTTSDPFAIIQAPHQLGSRVQLFDTAEQRDSFAAVMRESFLAIRDLDCAASSMFGSVFEFTPADVGYPGYGFKHSDQPGFEGASFTLQYLVGDRVLLTSTLAASGISENPDLDIDVALLAPFVDRQIASLRANGLG